MRAAQIGGDWYDAFMQPGGATVLVIGDVVGHDIQAAAAMSQVRTVMRTIGALGEERPSQILTETDRALANLQVSTTATAIVARVEQTPAERQRGVTRVALVQRGPPAGDGDQPRRDGAAVGGGQFRPAAGGAARDPAARCGGRPGPGFDGRPLHRRPGGTPQRPVLGGGVGPGCGTSWKNWPRPVDRTDSTWTRSSMRCSRGCCRLAWRTTRPSSPSVCTVRTGRAQPKPATAGAAARAGRAGPDA